MAVHGSKATFWTGTDASPAVLQDLSQYGNSIGSNFSRDTAETSTFAQGSKSYVPGLKDAQLPFAGPWDEGADAVLWPLYDNGTLVDFEYCPAGRGVVGTPKYTGQAFLTTYDVTSGLGGPTDVSAQFQVSGDVTRTMQ